ncbi:hypothetical protein Tco_0099091 [Tanacetum coccineum]
MDSFPGDMSPEIVATKGQKTFLALTSQRIRYRFPGDMSPGIAQSRATCRPGKPSTVAVNCLTETMCPKMSPRYPQRQVARESTNLSLGIVNEDEEEDVIGGSTTLWAG